MSKKTKKILTIILLSVLAACVAAWVVLYCIWKEQTVKITLDVWDYICNKPLPVIGISILALSLIVFKVLNVTAIKNRKIAALFDKCEALKNAQAEADNKLAEYKEQTNQVLEEKEAEIAALEEYIKKLCSLIPNKKVKQLGGSVNVKAKETKETSND